ncbi:RraA family protein [Colwellia sp. E150_009]
MYKINKMPPRINTELLELAQQAETATIGHFLHMGFAHRSIKHNSSMSKTVTGTAVTLALPSIDSTLLHHIVSLIRPGDILVIDRLGDDKYACLGGGVALALKRSNLTAVIIDGPITDPKEIKEIGLPVWSKGISNITTRLQNIWGAFNVPISCGGAVVMPGDLVIADDTGVVFLSPNEAQTSVRKAINMQTAEKKVHPKLGKDCLIGDLYGATKLVEEYLNKTI